LRANGLIRPIVVWQGQIIDGRHRERLCRELGIEPRYKEVPAKKYPTEKEMRVLVAVLNEHRRSRTTPLSNEEKRARGAKG
jgi:ParB-like chromosome segregation protein Spo0J